MRRLYWVKEGLRVVGIIFGAAALYTLLMTFSNTEDEPLLGLLRQSAIYLVVMGTLMTLLNNMSAHQNIIPLSLSFGCTRKEAIAGMQLYRLTVLICLLLGVSAMLILMGSGIAIWLLCIPTIIGVYLFFTAVGGLLGTFASKVHKMILGVISAAAMLLVLTFVVFVGLAFGSDLEELSLAPWILMAVGAAVYGICSIFEVRSVKRHYVR